MAKKQYTDEEARLRRNERQREYYAKHKNERSEYSMKYMKENTVKYYIQFHKSTDSDVIKYFESIGNKRQYLLGLIREDMRKQGLLTNDKE